MSVYDQLGDIIGVWVDEDNYAVTMRKLAKEGKIDRKVIIELLILLTPLLAAKVDKK